MPLQVTLIGQGLRRLVPTKQPTPALHHTCPPEGHRGGVAGGARERSAVQVWRLEAASGRGVVAATV